MGILARLGDAVLGVIDPASATPGARCQPIDIDESLTGTERANETP